MELLQVAGLAVAALIIVVAILVFMQHSAGPALERGPQAEGFAFPDPRVEGTGHAAGFGARAAFERGVVPQYRSNWSDNAWPGRKDVLVRFHFAEWDGASGIMRPVWERLRANHAGKSDKDEPGGPAFLFEEVDEVASPTPGIVQLPTLRKYRDGVAFDYAGPAEYAHVRAWLLSPADVRDSYFYLRR